jgi:hypothetical protein
MSLACCCNISDNLSPCRKRVTRLATTNKPDALARYRFRQTHLRFLSTLEDVRGRPGWIFPSPTKILVNVTDTEDVDTWRGQVEGSQECGKFLGMDHNVCCTFMLLTLTILRHRSGTFVLTRWVSPFCFLTVPDHEERTSLLSSIYFSLRLKQISLYSFKWLGSPVVSSTFLREIYTHCRCLCQSLTLRADHTLDFPNLGRGSNV